MNGKIKSCICKVLAGAMVFAIAAGTLPLASSQLDLGIKAEARCVEKTDGTVLAYDYDEETGTVTVKPGTYKDPYFDYDFFEKINYNKLDKVVIGKGVVLKGDCSYLFFESGVKTVDMRGADTSGMTDSSFMFSACRELTKVYLAGMDTSNVTNMSQMFSCCEKLASVDLTGFNTSKVTDMQFMFQDCYALKKLDLSSFDTSKVEMFNGIFYGCTALTTLDISNFSVESADDQSNTGIYFNYCPNLRKIKISDKFKIGEDQQLNNKGNTPDFTGIINGWKKSGDATNAIVSGDGDYAVLSGAGTYVWVIEDTGIRHHMDGSTLYLTAGEYDSYMLSNVCSYYKDGWDAYWNPVIYKIVFGKNTVLAGDCEDMFSIFVTGYSEVVEFEGVVDLDKVTNTDEMFTGAIIKSITFKKGTKITESMCFPNESFLNRGMYDIINYSGWAKESEPDKVLPMAEGANYLSFTADGGKYIHLQSDPKPLKNGSYLYIHDYINNGDNDKWSDDNKFLAAELGDTITLYGVGDGGDPYYSFTYMYKKSTSDTWIKIGEKYKQVYSASFKPTKAVNYDVAIIVKDESGATKMKTFTVSVKPKLNNNSYVVSENVKVGEKIVVKGAAEGGSKGYKYAFYYKKQKNWEWLPMVEEYTTKSIAIKPKSAVTYDIKAVVKDSEGRTNEKYFTVNVTK